MSSVVTWILLGAWMFAAIGRSLESGTWEGYASFGRAGSSFRPCGSRESWWLKSQGFSRSVEELEQRYHEMVEHPYELIYVRVRGEVSRKGQYGPLGSYQRVLYIEEVLDIRPASEREDECK